MFHFGAHQKNVACKILIASNNAIAIDTVEATTPGNKFKLCITFGTKNISGLEQKYGMYTLFFTNLLVPFS